MRKYADDIEAGSCSLSDEEATDLLSTISHRAISKEQACDFMNLRRAQFDNLIRAGKLPKGRKLRGRKELVWYEDELRAACESK